MGRLCFGKESKKNDGHADNKMVHDVKRQEGDGMRLLNLKF
jgi:hypothetical protein